MLTKVDSFLDSLLAGTPDTLEFPSSWQDNNPESVMSRICQVLDKAGFCIIPVLEDSVCFVAVSALQRHAVTLFQRGQQQAAPANQPGNSSACCRCPSPQRQHALGRHLNYPPAKNTQTPILPLS